MTICFGGNTNLWIQFIVLLTLRMCVLAISSRKINHLQIMIFVFIAWYWTSLNMILDVDVAGRLDDSGSGFCKNNDKALTFSPNGFVNDVDECFKYWNPSGVLGGSGWVKDGYLYALMNAYEFFEEGCKPPFSDLTEESNPVIVKLKLKKYEE